MDIKAEKNGNNLIISVSGELNTKTAPELLEFVNENVGSDTAVSFNLRSLDYLSSAGLRVMLVAQKKNPSVRVKILEANDLVKGILEDTGFTQMFEVL